jgi:hypothetical protein
MRHIRISTPFLLALTAGQCLSANFYVRKGATGSNNGSNWTNAWKEMDQINFSAVACGDTIWLGGGLTYSAQLTINKTCSAASPLTIQSLLASDTVPTRASGYTTSLLNPVVLLNGGVVLAAGSYVTLSGRQGTPWGNNFGISVQCNNTAGLTGCNAFGGATAGSISNMRVTYVEMYGPPCVLSENCGGGGASGFNVAPSNNTVNAITIDHTWIHQWGEAIRTSNWKNCIIQYTDIDTTHNDGMQHEDVIYNYAQTNFTIRYSRIWNSPNDGIFFDFGGTNGFYFYGNVFYHSGGEYIVFKSGYTNAANIYIYNNVFESDGNGDYAYGWLDFGGASSGSGAVKDNVFENVVSNGGETGAPPNADYNAYSVGAYKDSGAHSFTYTPGGRFLNEPDASNPVFADFQLTPAGATAFSNGFPLPAPYNYDRDDILRGTNGIWYIGAYQYLGTVSTPAPPTNLNGVVH